MMSINSNEAFIGIAFSRAPGSPLHAKSLGPITCVLLLVVEPLAAFAPTLVYATWGLESLYGSDGLHLSWNFFTSLCSPQSGHFRLSVFTLPVLRSLNSTVPHLSVASCSFFRHTVHIVCSFSIDLSACANLLHLLV